MAMSDDVFRYSQMRDSVRTINRNIARITFPAVASNITVPLLGLCDTAISGHLGSADYLAAIAAGAMMLNVVYWIMGFLRMATAGLTAEALGADNREAMARSLERTLWLALLIGVVAVALRSPLSELLLGLLAPPENVETLAGGYFMMCVWSAPAMLTVMGLSGWFIGMQNTLWPMVVSVSMNVVNVVLSLLAVAVWKMGFVGVAFGTVTATWLGAIMIVVAALVYGRLRGIKIRLTRLSSLGRGSGMSRFLRTGGDLFLRSACIMGVSMAVTAIGSRMGTMTLATNAVMMQFFVFFSYFMDGIAYSGEALCGRSVGERSADSFNRVVKALIVWGIVASTVFTLSYIVFGNNVVSLLTDDTGVRMSVESMMIYVWLIPAAGGAAFLYDGFFIGLTATRRMFLTTLLSAGIFAMLVITLPSDNRSLWIAFLSYLLARGLGLAFQLHTAASRRFS